MASESVEIIIEADNRASAKFNQLNKDVDASVKQIKEVGGQSKASTELVGTLANSLGSSAIGGFAGELAMLTERVSAFSEVSKAGGAGAMAFQAGLAGVAAVVSFKVGKAIGDVIFQTERWNEALAESVALSEKLDGAIAGLRGQQFVEDAESVRQIVDQEERRAAAKALILKLGKEEAAQVEERNRLQKERDRLLNQERAAGLSGGLTGLAGAKVAGMFAGTDEARAELKKRIDAQQEIIDASKEQVKQLTIIANEESKAAVAKQENSAKFVQGLRDELELLRATKEEQFAIQAARGTANSDDRAEAERLLRERDAIRAKQEAEKAAEAERKRAADARARESEAERKRLESVKSGIVEKLRREAIALQDGQVAARAYALEMQGIDKSLANQIAQTEALLTKKPKDIDVDIAATQGRLITRGPSDSIASKTEKNTAEIAKQMKRVANQLEQQQAIELKQGTV